MKKPLNKKNLIAFANNLYKETDSKIEYVPLCAAAIMNEDGNQTICCALGELYWSFIEEYGIANKPTTSMAKSELRAAANVSTSSSFLQEADYVNDVIHGPTDEKEYIARAKAVQQYLIQQANAYL